MNSRVAAFATAIAIAGSALLVSAGAVTAITTTLTAPAGTGTCAALAPAAKGPDATVEGIRAFADCEIDRRLVTLRGLAVKVTNARPILGPHAATLQTQVAAQRQGLAALRARIDTETSLAALRADLGRIVLDYRVYVLTVPKVNLVIGADAVVATQARFAQIASALEARIATAKAAGSDVTAAQSYLDAMATAVSSAVALAAPLPARLLPLTAAQYNAGTAGPMITAARNDLGQSRGLLKNALTDARACLQALR